jgi:hypothetical protein
MNVDKIYKLYMGKNILNKFRQDNGYKLKTYKKIWNGQEDNVYLMQIIDKIDIFDNNINFEEDVYCKLKEFYESVELS